jgi:hypothetical protein
MTRVPSVSGLMMSITKGHGVVMVPDLMSFFASLDDIAPIVSPLKIREKVNASAAAAQKRNAETTAALTVLSSGPPVGASSQPASGVRFEAEARPSQDSGSGAGHVPRMAVKPSSLPLEKCAVHIMLESLDLGEILEAVDGGQPPYGFPQACSGKACEASRFTSLVAVMKLAARAQVAQPAPSPAYPFLRSARIAFFSSKARHGRPRSG